VVCICRYAATPGILIFSSLGPEKQCINEPFRLLLVANGVWRSMSRSGNVWNNAAMESSFSSLKIERAARKMYRTRARRRKWQARAGQAARRLGWRTIA
jgi:transposase InsO family protein